MAFTAGALLTFAMVGLAIVAVAVVVGYSGQTAEVAETAAREQQLAA